MTGLMLNVGLEITHSKDYRQIASFPFLNAPAFSVYLSAVHRLLDARGQLLGNSSIGCHNRRNHMCLSIPIFR